MNKDYPHNKHTRLCGDHMKDLHPGHHSRENCQLCTALARIKTLEQIDSRDSVRVEACACCHDCRWVAQLAALREEHEKLKQQLEIDRAFHKVTLAERNLYLHESTVLRAILQTRNK